jgi:hypothetical protein
LSRGRPAARLLAMMSDKLATQSCLFPSYSYGL